MIIQFCRFCIYAFANLAFMYSQEEGEPKKIIEKVYFKNNDIFLNKE